MDNISIFLMSIKGKVPNEAMLQLKAALEKSGENGLQKVMILSLKNPAVGILLSLLFGTLGVDRFYKGDIKLGIAKLVVFLLSFVIFFVAVSTLLFSLSPYISEEELKAKVLTGSFVPLVLGSIGILVCYVWFIVDIFLVFFGIKKDNLKKIYDTVQ